MRKMAVGFQCLGVDFTEAEEQMALGSVNRNLDSFEELRKLNVPTGTEPALTGPVARTYS